MCFIMGYYKYVVKLIIKNIMGKLIIFILGWIFIILFMLLMGMKSLIMWDWKAKGNVEELFGEETWKILMLEKE